MVLRGLVAVSIGVAMMWHSAGACADAAEVEALIAKGNELRRNGTPGPALPYFQKAYELARTPRTTAQLGLCELAAGYPVEAADHLVAALQSPNDPSIVRYRQMLADALKMAQSQIGELLIEGNPPGAEVVVDGRSVGTLPLATSIKVAARNTEVVVRANGFAPRREVVSIIGGQRREITVSLEESERPLAPARPLAAAGEPPHPAIVARPTNASLVVEGRSAVSNRPTSASRLRDATWIFGGTAVAATGAAIALNLTANAKAADFDASCAGSPTSGIMAAPGVAAGACRDRYDSWQSYWRWSIVGYVTGAALGVTSTVLFFASQPRSQATAVHARLTCAPVLNGASCLGRF